MKPSSWHARLTLFAGMCTVAKEVIVALPTYTMQSILLPVQVCEKLELMNKSFV
uniref:Uncharacterized protein n=1 Tax=Cajanus cajan TaxID=3821 RepID=A0A151SLT8_CAJCA|nr:hypothetical protein KK1_002005 [Cajanus cajan]